MNDDFNPDEVPSEDLSSAEFNPDEAPSKAQKLRVMSYGPIEGEHTKSTNYGPFGNRLQPYDVAVSPNLLERHPFGSWINVAGRNYRVADLSYYKPGLPTHDTVELRDQHDLGHAPVRSLTGDEIRQAIEQSRTRMVSSQRGGALPQESEEFDPDELSKADKPSAVSKPKKLLSSTAFDPDELGEPETQPKSEPTEKPKFEPIPADPKPATGFNDWLHKTFGGIHLAGEEEYRERLATPEDIENVKYALSIAQKPLPYAKEAIHLGYQASPMRLIANTFPDTQIGKVMGGIADGMESIGTSLASPQNLALAASGIGGGPVAAKAMSAIFFGMAARRFPTQLKQLNATNDPSVKAKLITEMAAGLGLPLLGWKGGGKYAEEPDTAAGEVSPIEGKPTVSQAEGEVQAGDTRDTLAEQQAQAQIAPDIRAAADRHNALINEGQQLGGQAQLMRKMGVPVPTVISDRLQAINTELREGTEPETSVPIRNESTGATTKPAPSSPTAPVDPPETNPDVGKVSRALKNFRNWWERFAPRSWAVLRNQPNSPVVTEHARLLQAPMDYMLNFTKMSWLKGLRKLGDEEIIDAEDHVVKTFRQLKEAQDPQAWEKAVAQAPPDLQGYLRFRKAREAIEHQASDTLEVPREVFEDDPYVPRITNKDMSDIIQLHPRMASWTGQIREGIASFGKSRVYATMKEGIKNDAEYEPPLKAIWRREEFSTRLEATANMLKNLKQKGVLFDTLDEANAANPTAKGGAPMKLTGFGGRDLWVRSRQEGISLEQNLSPRGTSGALGRVVQMVNLFSRDPNFVNPLPHTTKNMLFKYLLARVTSPVFRRDVAEFKSSAPMRERFEDVMPFSKDGQRIDQLRAGIIGNWAEKLAATPGKLLGYSRKFIFGQADPAMRYSLWKSYVRKGMSDQEAANHVWIDLIRYDENSGGLNFWRSIPFNFFATWRTGSLITLMKQTARAPIRTTLFIGAIDYMREVIQRKYGLWTHMPHDYIEAPLMEMITGGPRKAAAVAATTLLFGPGGGQAPSTIKQAMEAVQGDPENRSRLMNMFWGTSLLWNTPAEWKSFQRDGNVEHLVKIVANAAFSTHSSLKYNPRRAMQYLPEWMPGMEKSALVKEAEALQGKIQKRQEKAKATFEKRHGVSATFEYTTEQQQIESLRRAAGQRDKTSKRSPFD